VRLSPRGKTGGWIATLVLVACACLSAPGVSSAAGPRLKVVGNDLVDARTGQVFVPRGVNWPSFEYACRDGYGYSNSATRKSAGPTAAGAALMARWHINTVRVPLNQDCWLGEDGLPAFGTVRGYRAAVRRWVSTLHRAGLAVILDLHWSGPAGVVSDGLRAMPDNRSDDFWRSVARRFKRDRSMIFDVFNEPYERYGPNGLVFDLTWDCWRSGGCNAPRPHLLQPLDGSTFTTIGLPALVDAIRSTGAKQPILLPGRHFANDLKGWLAFRPNDGQLIGSFHNYDFQPCNTTACWDETVAPVAAEVPVIAGEFGQIRCSASHVKRFMRWADRRGVGYLAWAWWVLPQRGCSTLAVIANVKGKARKPNGTALKAHLARLAPRVSLRTARTQALGAAIGIRVRCEAPCRARAAGRLLVGRAPSRLTPTTRSLAAGRSRRISLGIPKEARRAASAALRQGQPVFAFLTVVASDGSHSRQRQATVRLVD
jgi:endoglucanase